MSSFLDDMAMSSARRASDAKRREPFGALERRIRDLPAAPALRLSAEGFDVIAELKLRSPAQGALGAAQEDWLARVNGYAHGGAAAISVLTEPSRFDGSLEHLTRAAAALAPLGIPAMRKDFIVDPYQVLEARAAGAGGVLLIVRMLPRAGLSELLAAAAEHGLFVLLEAFDEPDLEVAQALLEARRPADAAVLLGINCRDLKTLEVVPKRFAELARRLPAHWPAVAESGVATPQDACEMRRLGYRLALIGTALMQSGDPRVLLADILSAARTARS